MATSPTTSTLGRAEEGSLRLGATLMTAAAIGFIGYAVIFFIRNFTGSFLELGIGPDEVDKDKDAIQAFSPQLYDYISHLHIAVAGFLGALGLAVALLSWYGVRNGVRWAWATAVAASVLALAVALPAHYPYGFATLGHLGLIYLATAIFVAGAVLAWRGLGKPRV